MNFHYLIQMNNEVLNFMKRYVIVVEPKKGDPDQSISINGKTRFLNSNKKRIKKKIFEVVEEKFPYLVDTREKKGEVMKTIKTYIDLVREL